MWLVKDLDRERGTVEIPLSSFESMNDNEEFMVINIIVTFCGRERLGEVGIKIPFSIEISLKKNGIQCIFGCISSKSKGRGEIGDMQDGFGEEEEKRCLK